LVAVVRRKTAGKRLIEDLTQPGDPFAVTVLIVESGRIADRLEKLDALLSGEQTLWMRLRAGRDGDLYVSVDSALAEARQQATVLRHLIAAVHRQRAGLLPVGGDDDLDGIA
jgi:glucose/arabinose dehydrogenase